MGSAASRIASGEHYLFDLMFALDTTWMKKPGGVAMLVREIDDCVAAGADVNAARMLPAKAALMADPAKAAKAAAARGALPALLATARAAVVFRGADREDVDAACETVLRALLRHGAAVTGPCAARALVNASAAGLPETVRTLCAAGADPDAACNRGKTPLAVARDPATVAVLVAAGARGTGGANAPGSSGSLSAAALAPHTWKPDPAAAVAPASASAPWLPVKGEGAEDTEAGGGAGAAEDPQ